MNDHDGLEMRSKPTADNRQSSNNYDGGGGGAAAEGRVTHKSSSPDLSSPPSSPSADSPMSSTVHADNHDNTPGDDRLHNSTIHVGGNGVEKSTTSRGTSAHATTDPTGKVTPAPPRMKRAYRRKNKDGTITANAAAAALAEAKEKELKLKKYKSAAVAVNPRKKLKTTDASSTPDATDNHLHHNQTKLSYLASSEPRHDFTTSAKLPTDFSVTRTSNDEAIHRAIEKVYPNNIASTASIRTVGLSYDPIRSATSGSASSHHPLGVGPLSPTPPKAANRASASPSISSLIDPPSANYPAQPHGLHPSQRLQPASTISLPSSPSKIPHALAQGTTPVDPLGIATKIDPDGGQDDSQMAAPAGTTKTASAGDASAGPSSNAASPKPARQKPAPPLPPGNGLLSSALFGGPISTIAKDSVEPQTPTIILEIPLKGEKSTTINFARLAEERYGFNALYPRIAAQRERLARVAAAGAALERDSAVESGDEMSVDDSDIDSNVDMGGTEADGGEVKRRKKRTTKAEEYNKDDGFIDDSEMLWEEQAAATKDGFFVYSGPLVPPNEQPAVDRPEATSTRGRGRGRGRGGRTRGTTSGRGGTSLPASGPGSRGGKIVRKPRITNADRANMEQEKADRERMAGLTSRHDPSVYYEKFYGGTPYKSYV
ncbi:MAG: hypothetical protein M1817_004234 [Caeruleum heppii]|nr:MAG: hypothetical protein M1817_004234 [Caeruleum heppii]